MSYTVQYNRFIRWLRIFRERVPSSLLTRQVRGLVCATTVAILMLAIGGITVEAFGPADPFQAHNATFGSARENSRLVTDLNYPNPINSVAFGPDGKTLVSTSDDGAIQLWDLTTYRLLRELLKGEGAGPADHGLAFSPDGKMLAAPSFVGTIQLWDVASWKPLGEPFPEVPKAGDSTTPPPGDIPPLGYIPPFKPPVGDEGVYGLAFSANSKTLTSVSRSGTIQQWDIARHLQVGEPLQTNYVVGDQVAFSPDGRMLAFYGNPFGQIQLWDLARHKLLDDPFPHEVGPVPVAFSPDGKILASMGVDAVQLWDLVSHRPVGGPLRWHTEAQFIWLCLGFSPDGKILAAGGSSQRLGAAFSPDKEDRTAVVQLWDVASQKTLGEVYKGRSGDVNRLVFSPDGKTLAVVTGENTIQVWDVSVR